MSEYTLYRSLCDMGFSQDRASRATDILLGRDEDHVREATNMMDEGAPSEEDLRDYAQWAAEYEERTLLARWASDYDDEQERMHRFDEADAIAAGLAV